MIHRLRLPIIQAPMAGVATPALATATNSADAPVPAAYPVAYDAAKQLHAAAAQQGNHEFAAHWAGQGAPQAREFTAEQLMALLEQELGIIN